MDTKKRCSWSFKDDLMKKYHDDEWGVPQHNSQLLFESLILDGFQAGLSWSTILKKRNNFRKAFDDFDPYKIIKYDTKKINELVQNTGIIRNKLKIKATIKNATAYLNILKEFENFDKYIWQFTEGKTIINQYQTWEEIPAQTKYSENMSKDLKKRGFSFVGPTICYAFMQAIGMVNDHTVDCFRYHELIKNNERKNDAK